MPFEPLIQILPVRIVGYARKCQLSAPPRETALLELRPNELGREARSHFGRERYSNAYVYSTRPPSLS
jgi:hypothetical protein